MRRLMIQLNETALASERGSGISMAHDEEVVEA